MSRRLPAVVTLAASLAVLALASAACSDSGGGDDDGGNTVTRIDGPATVDDGAGADQDGAPGASGAITTAS